MDVAHVMDQQAQGVGLGEVRTTWVEVVVDVGIHVGGHIISTIFLREPIGDVLDSLSKVVGLCRDVVVTGLTLVNVGHINKVKVRLPSSTVILYVVSEGRTLHEGMHVLVTGEHWVVVTETLQHRVCSVPGINIIL